MLLDLHTANRQSVLPRLKLFIERFSVPKHCMSKHFTIIIGKFLVIVVIDCRSRRINMSQILVASIIKQLLTECHQPRHDIRRRWVPVFIIALRAIFQIVLIRIDWLQRASGSILISIPLVFIVILRHSRFISRHRIVVYARRWRTRAASRIKILIVLPRIDHARMAVRRVFDAAALALLLRVANAVGQQMVAMDLGVCRCLEAPLLMHEVVDVVERVLAFIGRIDIVRGQRRVILVHLCIVERDIPIRITAAPSIREAIGVAVKLTLEVLQTLSPRVRSLDETLHILCCMIEVQRKTMILIKIIGCDKSDILNVAIVAQ